MPMTLSSTVESFIQTLKDANSFLFNTQSVVPPFPVSNLTDFFHDKVGGTILTSPEGVPTAVIWDMENYALIKKAMDLALKMFEILKGWCDVDGLFLHNKVDDLNQIIILAAAGAALAVSAVYWLAQDYEKQEQPTQKSKEQFRNRIVSVAVGIGICAAYGIYSLYSVRKDLLEYANKRAP